MRLACNAIIVYFSPNRIFLLKGMVVIRRWICIVFLLGGIFPAYAQIQNPAYDEELAEKLGADDYGMKSYLFVLLKTGTNSNSDPAFIARCFEGHMANIEKLVNEGKLIVAGPFGKNDQTYRGLFILTETDHFRARDLLNDDPAIKAGLLDLELFDWYGSAALGEYLKVSDKIWKVKP